MVRSSDPMQVRSREDLVELIAKGATPKYLFFWGHTPRVPSRIDQSCLSNWFPARFTVDGTVYPTTEHYMMAEKARLFGDDACLDGILAATHPGAAKRLGREVRGFEEGTWMAHRFEIVVAGNVEKFRQNIELGRFLAGTASRVLVEASPRDRIWGIGMAKDHPNASHPAQWNGLNLLGFALMEVRAQLFHEPPNSP